MKSWTETSFREPRVKGHKIIHCKWVYVCKFDKTWSPPSSEIQACCSGRSAGELAHRKYLLAGRSFRTLMAIVAWLPGAPTGRCSECVCQRTTRGGHVREDAQCVIRATAIATAMAKMSLLSPSRNWALNRFRMNLVASSRVESSFSKFSSTVTVS
jgi:hypothetical protein